MVERNIRIGILGAGSIATTHAIAYRGVEGAVVIGVWSRTPERAHDLASRVGATAVADARELIEDSQIDVIDVCVPSKAHRGFVTAALDAGKHVICETPVSLVIEDAQAMADASRAAKRLLFVASLTRFVADYVRLREEVRSCALGRLRSIALWRLSSYLQPDAAEARSHYADPSLELMTFDFDFLNWLLGPAQGLCAGAALTDDGAPGEITAVVRYAEGVSAVVTGSGLMPKGFPYTIGCRAILDQGVIEHATVFEDEIPASSLVIHGKDRTSAPLRLRRESPYESELRHCIECIRLERPSELLSIENSLAALRLSLATQQALRDGGTVPL